MSFPFVPGHEVVGELDDGTRVILEPVLGHEARGLRSPVRRRRARRRRRLRPPRDRRPRARHPDRVLLFDRRRLGPGVRRPRVAAPPHRRRHARRARRARRAVRRRHPRRAARGTRRRRPPGHVTARPSSPCSAPARWAWPRSPACGATSPTCGSSSAPATRTSASSPRPTAPTSSSRPTSSPGRSAAPPAATSSATTSSSGAHVTIDAVGTSATVADSLRITRPRGRVVLLGMPADVTPRPHRALAPRDRTQGRLHLRHRDAARRPHLSHVRPRHRDRQRPSRPSGCSRPPTHSPTTSTPSPTPPPPAAAAPSRSPSTCGTKEAN